MDAFFEILRWVKALFFSLLVIAGLIGAMKWTTAMAKRTRWVKDRMSEDSANIVFGHIALGLYILMLYKTPDSVNDWISDWINR